jgi:citrate lyase subunit beta/citryl-CoA lyase
MLYRSHLFVPGGREELLEKASGLTADVLCLDLEESVLPEEKPHARELVKDAIPRLAEAGKRVHVRVNSIQSEETKDDLAAAVQAGLSGAVLAKTESAAAVRQVDVLLREQELAHDVKPGTVDLIVAIESAAGLLRCEEISHASTRLTGLMLGGEDFAFDMGIRRTKDSHELTHARSEIAICARAAGVQAFDTPWAHIDDIDGLVAEAEQARMLGFSGKYVIHPKHIEPVHDVFSPSEDEIVYARKVLEAWKDAQSKGLGAIQLDGHMVDRPIAERARHIVDQAEAISTAATGNGAISGGVTAEQ